MRALCLITLALVSCGRWRFHPLDSDPDSGGDAIDADVSVVCGPAYQRVAGLSSRYRMGGAATTWQLAEQNCESDGGHLPVINDSAENTWLASQVIGWIGLSDHVTEGVFVHVTGAVPGYSNWNPSEPSNNGGIEDCAAFYLGIEWNDDACDLARVYMCECDGAPMPSPPVWCVTGLDTSCNTCSEACPVGTSCGADQTCI